MNITPKDKALELANKFLDNYLGKYKSDTHQRLMYKDHGIDDALILCDEVLNLDVWDAIEYKPIGFEDETFWQSVRKELEALKS